jgi:hypothetical protein
VGEVSQVVEGGDKLLQEFPDELGPFHHLNVEHCFQLVASVMILKHLDTNMNKKHLNKIYKKMEQTQVSYLIS